MYIYIFRQNQAIHNIFYNNSEKYQLILNTFYIIENTKKHAIQAFTHLRTSIYVAVTERQED